MIVELFFAVGLEGAIATIFQIVVAFVLVIQFGIEWLLPVLSSDRGDFVGWYGLRYRRPPREPPDKFVHSADCCVVSKTPPSIPSWRSIAISIRPIQLPFKVSVCSFGFGIGSSTSHSMDVLPGIFENEGGTKQSESKRTNNERKIQIQANQIIRQLGESAVPAPKPSTSKIQPSTTPAQVPVLSTTPAQEPALSNLSQAIIISIVRRFHYVVNLETCLVFIHTLQSLPHSLFQCYTAPQQDLLYLPKH